MIANAEDIEVYLTFHGNLIPKFLMNAHNIVRFGSKNRLLWSLRIVYFRRNRPFWVKATWRTIWRIMSWRTNFFTWRTQTVGEQLLAVAQRKIRFGEHKREFLKPMTLRQHLGGETRPYHKIKH